MLPLLFVAFLAVDVPDDVAQQRVAVIPFVMDGVAFDEAERIDAELRSSVEAATKERALGRERTAELLLAAETLGIDCDRTTPTCVAELGTVLAVDTLVFGRAEKTRAGLTLTVRVVDVETQSESRRVTVAIAPTADRKSGITSVVFRAFHDPTNRLGALSVTAAPGARIVVDDDEVGVAPLKAAISGLTMGDHTVASIEPNGVRRTTTVTVRASETLRVDLTGDAGGDSGALDAAAHSVLYTGLGVGGLGAAMFVAALIPYIVGWFLFVSLDIVAIGCRDNFSTSPCRERLEGLKFRQSVYAPLANGQIFGFLGLGLGAFAAALGVGVATGGGVMLLLLEPPGASE